MIDPKKLVLAERAAVGAAARVLLVPVDTLVATVRERGTVGRPSLVTDDEIRAAVEQGGTRAEQAARVGLQESAFRRRVRLLSSPATPRRKRS